MVLPLENNSIYCKKQCKEKVQSNQRCIRDLSVICQPSSYDRSTSTIHEVVTWSLSTSLQRQCDDENETATTLEEWGEQKSDIHFYRWLLYVHNEQLHNSKSCLDDELLHRLLGGEMTNRATPLCFPLPLETTMMVDYLTMICVLLENSDDDEMEYDGVHTFDTEPDIFAIKNAFMFCTRGMYQCMKSCEPIQKELKFKNRSMTRDTLKDIYSYINGHFHIQSKKTISYQGLQHF